MTQAYILWSVKLGSRIKEADDVRVRKTLKLVGID